MDWIVISDLEIEARVGVPAAERERSQKLSVTVEMERELRTAGASDDVADTIDYAGVAAGLRDLASGREWKLIEALAADAARWILAEFGPASVAVTVKKFVLERTGFVAVRIARP